MYAEMLQAKESVTVRIRDSADGEVYTINVDKDVRLKLRVGEYLCLVFGIKIVVHTILNNILSLLSLYCKVLIILISNVILSLHR